MKIKNEQPNSEYVRVSAKILRLLSAVPKGKKNEVENKKSVNNQAVIARR